MKEKPLKIYDFWSIVLQFFKITSFQKIKIHVIDANAFEYFITLFERSFTRSSHKLTQRTKLSNAAIFTLTLNSITVLRKENDDQMNDTLLKNIWKEFIFSQSFIAVFLHKIFASSVVQDGYNHFEFFIVRKMIRKTMKSGKVSHFHCRSCNFSKKFLTNIPTRWEKKINKNKKRIIMRIIS